MKKLTKIVATISDSRCDVDFLKTLYSKGMDVVRINTAHQNPEDSLKVIANVRAVSDKIPILIDTKGPEIRTCEMQPLELAKGELVSFYGSGDIPDGKSIKVTYEFFASEIPIGTMVLIDDGEIAFKVLSKTDNYLNCAVLNPGKVKGRKSINVPGVTLNLPSLSEKDIHFIRFAAAQDVDFIAHSFVRSKQDVLDVQKILDEEKSEAKVIAKIENQTGIDNIDEILSVAYGIMVARGDLGIEIAAEKIPGIQKRLIAKANHYKKPVIVATQMLHSMITNPRPTRAEVTDVANAIYHETDAIMLSGETAYGEYPVEAVETMTRIAFEVEKSKEVRETVKHIAYDGNTAIFLADAAVTASIKLHAKAIVLDTLSGRTGHYVAAFRGPHNVFAICYSKKVMRKLALSYGIYANCLEQRSSTEDFKKDALELLMEKKYFDLKDLIVIIGGSFGPRNGATFLDISQVENLIHIKENWNKK
ncbi:MAG TPA: pyruvate kinase [Bacteroidales bacterium]|nr:pyruvate kinase [Bacteroidales bacterium]